MQENTFGKAYKCSSWKVSTSAVGKVHSGWHRAFLGCCLFAIPYRFLSRSAWTSQKNTALKKRLVFFKNFSYRHFVRTVLRRCIVHLFNILFCRNAFGRSYKPTPVPKENHVRYEKSFPRDEKDSGPGKSFLDLTALADRTSGTNLTNLIDSTYTWPPCNHPLFRLATSL